MTQRIPESLLITLPIPDWLVLNKLRCVACRTRTERDAYWFGQLLMLHVTLMWHSCLECALPADHQRCAYSTLGNFLRPQSKQLGSELVWNHSNQPSFSELFWLILAAFPTSDYVRRHCQGAVVQRDQCHWPMKSHLGTYQIRIFLDVLYNVYIPSSNLFF